MSMTEAQAKQLGQIITKARLRAGVSVRGLAKELELSFSWLAKLESGTFPDPAPQRLALIAERLNISAEQLDRLTRGAVSSGLPEPRVYFRSKLELNQEETAKVMRYIERLRRAG